MKRIKIKYRELYTWHNVKKAIKRYNKNRPLHRKIPEEIEDKVAITLIKALKNLDSIDFNKYRIKVLKKSPTCPKERKLLIPSKSNLLIQACLIEVLEKEIDNKIPMNSYSSRKNRGAHRLMKNLRHFISTVSLNKNLYCLYFDIHKFYDNIDHDILFNKVKNLIKDKNILKLLEKIIYSTPGKTGIPIGNACSHILANLYQSELLKYVNNSPRRQFSALYMDNWVILSTNKKNLHSLKKTIFKKLKDINLEVNSDYQVFKVTQHRGVKIAGFTVFRNCKTYCYKATWKRIKKTISRIKSEQFVLKDARSFMSRLGTFKHIEQYKKIILDISFALFNKIKNIVKAA